MSQVDVLALSAATSAESSSTEAVADCVSGCCARAAPITPSSSNTGKIILINKVVWVHKSRDSGAKGQYAKIPKMTRNGSGRHPGAYNYRQLCTSTFRKPMPRIFAPCRCHPQPVTASTCPPFPGAPPRKGIRAAQSGTAACRPYPGNTTGSARDTDRDGTKEAGILRPPRLWNELFIGQGQESQFVGEDP